MMIDPHTPEDAGVQYPDSGILTPGLVDLETTESSVVAAVPRRLTLAEHLEASLRRRLAQQRIHAHEADRIARLIAPHVADDIASSETE